jgi:hypothetical protein
MAAAVIGVGIIAPTILLTYPMPSGLAERIGNAGMMVVRSRHSSWIIFGGI